MFNTHRGLPLLALAALLLAACGGGGTTSASGSMIASVTGEVVEIDGQDALLSGVVLELAETGETTVTAADGSFAFEAAHAGTLTLELLAAPRVGTTAASGSPQGPRGDDGHRHEGGDGHHGMPFDDEEIDDGEDADEDDVWVHRVRDRERVHVRLHIRDGAICEMECVREEHRECEVEVLMTSTEDNEDEDLTGKLELESRDDRERFKVRVWNATRDLDLEVVVMALDGDEENLGVETVDEDGEAAWTLDASLGDPLPFDALTAADLEGCWVEVRDADTATALLEAEVPAMPPFRWQYAGEHAELQSQVREQERSEEPALDRSGDLDHDRDQDQEGDRTGYDEDAENARGD